MRKYFIAGMLFWIPVWVTFVVIRFIIDLMDRSLALLPDKYQPIHLIGYNIPGLGLIFTIFLVFITGLIVTNFLGKRILHLWEKILSTIPLVRSIYTAVKQVVHALIQPQSKSYRKVVMVEFPKPEMWAIGFQTTEQLTNLPNQTNPVAVFVPTSPNPTSGFLVLVPKGKVTELDMTVEEAFKIIISIGVAIPPRDLCKYTQHREREL